MIASPLGLLVMLVAVLSVVLLVGGGIMLFVVGKGRGAMPGAGFVVLGIGVALSTLLSVFLPMLVVRLHLSASAASAILGPLGLLFDLVGWGLIIAAMFRFRAETPQAAAGPTPPPGYGPPPPYEQPGYAPPPAYGQPPGQPPAYGQPGPGPDPYGRQPGYGTPPGPPAPPPAPPQGPPQDPSQGPPADPPPA